MNANSGKYVIHREADGTDYPWKFYNTDTDDCGSCESFEDAIDTTVGPGRPNLPVRVSES